MKTYFKKYAKYFDYPLFFTFVLLCLFGLVMIYSSSMFWAVNTLGQAPDYFYKRQLVNLILAMVTFLIGFIIPYKRYKDRSMMLFIIGAMLFLLIAVFFVGYSPGNSGAKSWLNLGLFNLQPSELAKLGMILYFAAFFTKKRETGKIDIINESIVPPIGVFMVVLFFIALEPDMGAIGLLTIIVLSVMAASGMKFKTFGKIIGTLIGGMLAVFLLLFIFKDSFFTERRMGRLKAYLDPFKDADAFGYQMVNGYYAIGSGGVKGLGLGQSVQKMGYLPEPQTDFILAIISEELGTFGIAVVLFGLGFIVYRSMRIAIKAKDPLARMIAAGVGSWIGIQTFVNVGGLSGIIPLTGVPLPFISYGGTSVILLSLAMGILANVSMMVKREQYNNERLE
ncbi:MULTISPECIES: FtsW/RodA/SpoVE family cell cycle protein [Rummeliibacillus]|uniref:Probable peptidoglycan glycosyltransferase FtsW n=1 Tax=Rummeliibacillus stabekisii TaxID=241244 RepID=A0A143H988_9BACL|nr:MULTISPECIES: FtsW/RodA/SpoVE family cell cycle protein [Rummeliibacillus]AMW98304.1 cell division protein FtsW [Rummeliibacillus stabekisii]